MWVIQINFMEKRMKKTMDKSMEGLSDKEKTFFRKLGNGIIRNVKSIVTFVISMFFYFMLLDKVGFEKTIVLLISIIIFVINKNNKDKNKGDIF